MALTSPDQFQTAGLAGRVVVALLVLAPLGLCLGMCMPLGLGLVGRLSVQRQSYVAWSWAVNGFFSVIGSVLTTILSMTYGFRAVQLGALVAYAVAVAVFIRLDRSVPPPSLPEPVETAPVPATEPRPAPV